MYILVSYFTGGNGSFRVNASTGEITVVKPLESKYQSQYVLNKTATDKTGSTAVLKVAVIVMKTAQQPKCPKL